ncbi:MAG: hypothetical protein Q8P56_05620 [Candidatus Uhrbacteria bacterium]|nr:hypothetical protein [Candidatus Uhrbacteria bacterium]
MKLYFKGKLSQRSYPVDEPISGKHEKEFPDEYVLLREREEEIKKMRAEYKALSEVYSGIDANAVPKERRAELDRWEELHDMFNPRFVEDSKTLGKLSRGETMEVTELTIPDNHPILDYLEAVTDKSRTISYRIPSNILWEHLGKKRDWSVRFRTLMHSFENTEAEIVQPQKSELHAKGDDKILLYHVGPIKFITPQEVEVLERRYAVLKRLCESVGGDDALMKKNRTAYFEWKEVKDVGQGAQVYLSEDDARKAAGEKRELVVFGIPKSYAHILNALREKQDADTSFYLPWKLLWDTVIQEKDTTARWEHKLKSIAPTEGDELSLGNEGRPPKGKR